MVILCSVLMSVLAQGEEMVCPGFMPSRLEAGGRGRVLPDTILNLRDQPAIDGEQLEQITGGEVFDILAGPECDPAGIAWWQIDYGGLVGWVAEGLGDDYWL